MLFDSRRSAHLSFVPEQSFLYKALLSSSWVLFCRIYNLMHKQHDVCDIIQRFRRHCLQDLSRKLCSSKYCVSQRDLPCLLLSCTRSMSHQRTVLKPFDPSTSYQVQLNSYQPRKLLHAQNVPRLPFLRLLQRLTHNARKLIPNFLKLAYQEMFLSALLDVTLNSVLRFLLLCSSFLACLQL